MIIARCVVAVRSARRFAEKIVMNSNSGESRNTLNEIATTERAASAGRANTNATQAVNTIKSMIENLIWMRSKIFNTSSLGYYFESELTEDSNFEAVVGDET